MSKSKVSRGRYSETARLNMLNLMQENKIGYAELVRRLATVGWPLPILAVRRAASGDRRLTLDDAGAIAQVFGTTIADLVDPKFNDEYRTRVLKWLLAEAEWVKE